MVDFKVDLKNLLIESKFTTSSSIIVFSGAGMSAESGIATFRDSGGLWANYKIEEVATPEAWQADPEKVLDFYNMRRKRLLESEPNDAHRAIANLAMDLKLKVITQNIDDLHERAGSNDVLHLHGELRKARSSRRDDLIYDIEGWELRMGDFCELGSQLRPHVVWFGEMVPAMDEAIPLVQEADIMIVIGSSLQVYPAASLVQVMGGNKPVIVVDPASPNVQRSGSYFHLPLKAVEAMELIAELIASY